MRETEILKGLEGGENMAVQFVDNLLSLGLREKASDIHLVPGEIMNDKLIDDVIKAVNSGLEVDGLYFDPDANMWKFVAVL